MAYCALVPRRHSHAFPIMRLARAPFKASASLDIVASQGLPPPSFSHPCDGNGRRNLIASVPYVLASTANYLKTFGWRCGGGNRPSHAEGVEQVRQLHPDAGLFRRIAEEWAI